MNGVQARFVNNILRGLKISKRGLVHTMNKNITEKELYNYLVQVDNDFPVALSDKLELTKLSKKLYERADVVVERVGGRVVGIVAGYATNSQTDIAFISIVSVSKFFRGQKLGEKMIRTFLNLAYNCKCKGVELYTTKDNYVALRCYEKIGFTNYVLENETRPKDVHLIYRFEEEM